MVPLKGVADTITSLRDDDLAYLMGMNTKELHKLCGRLKEDRFLEVYVHSAMCVVIMLNNIAILEPNRRRTDSLDQSIGVTTILIIGQALMLSNGEFTS